MIYYVQCFINDYKYNYVLATEKPLTKETLIAKVKTKHTKVKDNDYVVIYEVGGSGIIHGYEYKRFDSAGNVISIIQKLSNGKWLCTVMNNNAEKALSIEGRLEDADTFINRHIDADIVAEFDTQKQL